MNIAYFLRDRGGCSYVRVMLPMSEIKAQTSHKLFKIEKGDPADKILQNIEPADIIVIPRVSEKEYINFIIGLQKEGKKIVIDFDDNLFCVSPLSPHYEEFGTENIKVRIDKEELTLWEDGKNINLKANQKRLDNIRWACEIADAVTVTTPILAQCYEPYAKRIFVLPNSIKPELWESLPLPAHDEIRLFWAGGASHYEDWCILSDVLPPLFEKYKNLRLVIMGSKFDGTLKRIPKDRISFQPWVETAAYPYVVRILNPDIGLIPLLDTQFNRAKSPIKFLEYAGLPIASCVSYVPPYDEMAHIDMEAGVFIENNDTSAWIEGLSMLIEDRIYRAKIAGKAYELVTKHFNIHNTYKLWLECYEKVLEA